MRSERLYLLDIIEAADNVVFHVGGKGRDEFLGDRTIRAAVLHELTVIGEAANHLSTELRARHSEVPWADVIGFRNVVAHEYFGVSWEIVWETAARDVPDLQERVRAVLVAEFPAS